MDKPKTIIVIGAGKTLPSELIAQIKHSHGEDMIIISDEEAKEKGIIPNIEQKPFIFKAMPEFKTPFIDVHAEKNDCKKGWRK